MKYTAWCLAQNRHSIDLRNNDSKMHCEVSDPRWRLLEWERRNRCIRHYASTWTGATQVSVKEIKRLALHEALSASHDVA